MPPPTSTSDPFNTSYLNSDTPVATYLSLLTPYPPTAPAPSPAFRLPLTPTPHCYRCPGPILRLEFHLTATSPSFLRFRTRLHEFFTQYRNDMIIQEKLHIRNKARMLGLLRGWEFKVEDVEGLGVGGVVKKGEVGWEGMRERGEEVGYLTRAAALWALVETMRVVWRRGVVAR